MSRYLLGFHELDKTMLPLAGGKGANLGELSGILGLAVPEGFCVTTQAYREIAAHGTEFGALMDELAPVKADERERIADISGRIRRLLEGAALPEALAEEVGLHLAGLGENAPYAVRSSATAEDLPAASFAGQQDTYLNIIGKDAVLKHIAKCWASLFTDRAVTYRIQNGFDHRGVYLSVVVQKMIFPESSGILFTADPVTSHRGITSIDAGFGLGEALVSGLVDADIYKVREGKIFDKKIAAKKLAIHALPEGGTEERPVAPERQKRQTLTDAQIVALAELGRKIEAHFGAPQDIEWCLSEDKFYILQSRPITTLFPIPEVKDGRNHVYMSLSHQQMMTDAIRPLGISMFLMYFEKTGNQIIAVAGGRLYLDVTHDLVSRVARKVFINTGLGSVDILIRNALIHVTKLQDYLKSLPRGRTSMSMGGGMLRRALLGLIEAIKITRKNDPGLMQSIMARNDALFREAQRRISAASELVLFDLLVQDMEQLVQTTVFDNFGPGTAAVMPMFWLDKKMKKWLGEENVTAALSQSVQGNITSEMGLDLLEVADVVRQYPAVIAYLKTADNDSFFEEMAGLEGGGASAGAIRAYLEKYGARCPGEIDITRPRWAEKPAMLAPLILNNVRNFGLGSRKAVFEQGLEAARQKERELLARLRRLPGGKRKAKKAAKQISLFRNLIGIREYPKYVMMRYYHLYKQAFLRKADALVRKGVIREQEDIYYLTFEELRDAVRTERLDYGVIEKRRAEFEIHEKLTPPRVMTSDGEVISGAYDTGVIPEGALQGIPVSAGIAEGRARVITRLEDADIEEGDILVTAFTDPSWTPLFVSIKGLVTEVGGMMTHGAVVAREYGLPAVVSVENATKLIRDGQQIRVNGEQGYVEML